jgi:hypothetical protein
MLGLHSIPTFVLHFILLLSCSLHMLWKRSKLKWWMKGDRNANGGRRAENEI